ncbi:MAG: replication-associated recombination protein A [Gammaproteobacteria bacterium]|nr:replication-associated recombination protein A [Gammaproteobacteria bacterium]
MNNTQPEGSHIPLADRMRPNDLGEIAGQEHLLGKGKPLRHALESGNLHSMVFWGPPGTGKTTLARVIAKQTESQFIGISAVLCGIKDIRDAVATARKVRQSSGRGTILFVDEAHRFNKSQQDAFLPHVEDGTITFIGATTENPSFELNNALLSRARVYQLKSLTVQALRTVIERALTDARAGISMHRAAVADAVCERIADAADGDARRALNILETAVDMAVHTGGTVETTWVDEIVSGANRRFDKRGDTFYDQISALHKSIRGSSPDASLYWLTRMLDGGCDPTYLARRLTRIASEDIGNADPRALQVALDAWNAYERLGSPEGELALAQAAVYLACAPKSNAVYLGYREAMRDSEEYGSKEVPTRLRNAPTAMMKELGFGGDYRYAHDEDQGYAAGESYFPDDMPLRQYYRPTQRGLEKKIAEKLAYLRKLDAEYYRQNKKTPR